MNIIVRWEKMGPEFTYGVWYTRQPEGPWLRDNHMRLTDDIIEILRDVQTGEYYETSSYNEYVIDNLDALKNYSVKVTCEDRYDAWWYSQSSYSSIGGGLSAPNTRPSPNNGNSVGFQFRVV